MFTWCRVSRHDCCYLRIVRLDRCVWHMLPGGSYVHAAPLCTGDAGVRMLRCWFVRAVGVGVPSGSLVRIRVSLPLSAVRV
jgi:hypothetical protein